MPTPSNVQLTVSINGGAPQTGPIDGGIEVAANDVVQLGIVDSTGASQIRFEIRYPPGYSLPSGWSLSEDGYTYYYSGVTPPTFTISSDDAVWGNWIPQLVVNNGRRPDPNDPTKLIAAPDLIDDSIGLWKPSPSGLLKDTGILESNQFDQSIRQWVTSLQANWRALDAIMVAAGGEANLIGSVGTGASLAKGKSGVTLQVRSLTEGDLILIAQNTDDVEIAVDLDGLQDLIDAAVGGDPSAITFPYKYKTATTKADPGDAAFRLDAAPASATGMYIDLVDGVGRTLTSFFDSISTGVVWIVKANTPTVWYYYRITARTTETGYRDFTLQALGGQGVLSNDDDCRVFFIEQPSNAGLVGDEFRLNYDDATDAVGIQANQIRFNAALGSATEAYVSAETIDAGNIDDYLNLLTTGFMTVELARDRTVRYSYTITNKTDETDYVTFAITKTAGQGSVSDGDPLHVSLQRQSVAFADAEDVLTGTETAKIVTPDALAALWEKNTTPITSGGTITLGEGGVFDLNTSTAAITAFSFTTSKAGRIAWVKFNTVRELTYNATSLILQGAANITTAVGDYAAVLDLGSGNVQLFYFRADGTAVVGGPPSSADFPIDVGATSPQAFAVGVNIAQTFDLMAAWATKVVPPTDAIAIGRVMVAIEAYNGASFDGFASAILPFSVSIVSGVITEAYYVTGHYNDNSALGTEKKHPGFFTELASSEFIERESVTIVDAAGDITVTLPPGSALELDSTVASMRFFIDHVHPIAGASP